MKFNTVEEALDELRAGKIILSQMMRTERMRAISSVRQNLPQQKTSTLWRCTARV